MLACYICSCMYSVHNINSVCIVDELYEAATAESLMKPIAYHYNILYLTHQYIL